jgi:branched-chain amino acid transport system permease protein
MGILAHHAQTYTPLTEWPFLIEGTKSMPVIWLVAILVSALAALVIGLLSLRTSGVYFIMITLAFGQMFFFFTISWAAAMAARTGCRSICATAFRASNTLDPIQFYALCLGLLLALCLHRAASGRALRPGAERRAAAPRAGRRGGARPVSAAAGRLHPVGGDHRAGGRAVCRSQPLRQPVDVQLADQRRTDDLRHPRRRRAAVRARWRARCLFVALEHWLGGVWDYWHICWAGFCWWSCCSPAAA